MYNFVSFAGIFILMAFAWTLSSNRRVINWHVIIWGCIIQMIFALFIFVAPAGAKVFMYINDALIKVIDVASSGTKFLFGRLALPPGTTNEWGEESLGFIFAIQTLPQIIFFASLMAVLYYAGIMSSLVRFFAKIFTKLMRVSGAEALCASSNIFVGGIAALVPKRTADLSAVGPRALLAATLACLMTASVAGVFFNGSSILLGR